jgi:hypothetical protein
MSLDPHIYSQNTAQGISIKFGTGGRDSTVNLEEQILFLDNIGLHFCTSAYFI